MRFLRIFVPILAAITVVATVGIYILSLNENDAPVLESINGNLEIEIPCSTTDEELLKLVRATDKQDGDISDKITIQKNLYFTEKGTIGVTFAVCDSDNNVSKLGMNVHYSDYVSPKIDILADLVIIKKRPQELIKAFKVEDVLDGDITNRLKVISSEYNYNYAGEYLANCKVTNSHGDTTELNIDLVVVDSLNQADIMLNDYCVYVPVGTEIDYNSYISEVLNAEDHHFNTSDVKIDASEYDPTKPGVYNIFYKIESGGNIVAMSRLFVIVEGGEG